MDHHNGIPMREVDEITSMWMVTWGPEIEMRPWPRFKRKWKGRIVDAWSVLRGQKVAADWDELA